MCALVTPRERLARFGTGPLAPLLSHLDCALEVVGDDEDVSTSQKPELVRDMLAVVTSFSGRLSGARSARARALRAAVASETEAVTPKEDAA
jgi:predicted site-specific integrase-resolvase